MNLVKVLSYSIIIFFSLTIIAFILGVMNLNLYDYEFLSAFIFGGLATTGAVIFFLPMIIALFNKDVDSKVTIFLISLAMPIIGGVISYFVIRHQVKEKNNKDVVA